MIPVRKEKYQHLQGSKVPQGVQKIGGKRVEREGDGPQLKDRGTWPETGETSYRERKVGLVKCLRYMRDEK